MTYPKPLSEKALEKKYEEAHITGEKREFLHKFFAACANLYGAIGLNDMWEIYIDLKDQFPMIHKNDMARFSLIARREDQPYRIFRHEELFDGNDGKGSDNWLIHKDLIGSGSRKLFLFHALLKARGSRPYYLSGEMLSNARMGYTENDKALLEYLSYFVSINDFNIYGVPNVNKGKLLGEFSYLTVSERYETDKIKDYDAQMDAIREKTQLSAAEKILKDIILVNNVGRVPPSFHFLKILGELSDVWVEIDEGKRKELRNVFVRHYNNSRLWCLGGWTADELHLSCERMHEVIPFSLRQ